MERSFSLAALLLAPDATASDVDALETMSREAAALGAAPVIVALPPDVAPPSGARVVRTKPGGARVTAIRLGMAQLTNTTARVVLLHPLTAEPSSASTLRALVQGFARAMPASDRIVALAGASLDHSPVLVPRDAWLELVTLGEGGLDALAARRPVHRVAVENAGEE